MSWHPDAEGRRSARPRDCRLRPELEDLESRALLSTVAEYPGPYQFPSGIAAGKGGVIWTADMGKDTLTELSADGTTIATYPIPDVVLSDISLAVATDGRVWFAPRALGEVGVLDPTTGAVTMYNLPVNLPSATGLVAAPDGSIGFIALGGPQTWFGHSSGVNGIGRVAPDGSLSFTTTPGIIPESVLVGPDGAVSFLGQRADDGSAVLGRVAADGSVATTALPPGVGRPSDLQAGADGSVWFLSSWSFNGEGTFGSLEIGRVAADGTVSEFPLPKVPDPSGGIHAPFDLRLGPDGNLYYLQGGQIVRMAPDGSFARFALPGVGFDGYQNGLHATIGGDGALWFDYYAGITTPAPGVGRLSLDGDAGWTPIGDGAPKSPVPPAQPAPPVVTAPPVTTPPVGPRSPVGPTVPGPFTGPIAATPILDPAPARPVAPPAQAPAPTPEAGSWLAAPASLYAPIPEAADLTVVGQAHPGAKSARSAPLTHSTAPLLG